MKSNGPFLLTLLQLYSPPNPRVHSPLCQSAEPDLTKRKIWHLLDAKLMC